MLGVSLLASGSWYQFVSCMFTNLKFHHILYVHSKELSLQLEATAAEIMHWHVGGTLLGWFVIRHVTLLYVAIRSSTDNGHKVIPMTSNNCSNRLYAFKLHAIQLHVPKKVPHTITPPPSAWTVDTSQDGLVDSSCLRQIITYHLHVTGTICPDIYCPGLVSLKLFSV